MLAPARRPPARRATEIGTSRSFEPLPRRIRNGWPGAERAARQGDQLARAQARPVEQFEQGEVAQRDRLAARRAVLGGFEHARDIVGRRGSAAAAARSAGAAARPTGRPCGCPHRRGSRRSAAARPTAARRSTAPGRAHSPPRPRQLVAARVAQASAERSRPPARGRCDRRRACCATRPPRPPSCRGTGRRAPDRRRRFTSAQAPRRRSSAR